MPSKHVLANREANSRHTYDVTIWLSRTTNNSNIFIRSREVRDNESRLYIVLFGNKKWDVQNIVLFHNKNRGGQGVWCYLVTRKEVVKVYSVVWW